MELPKAGCMAGPTQHVWMVEWSTLAVYIYYSGLFSAFYTDSKDTFLSDSSLAEKVHHFLLKYGFDKVSFTSIVFHFYIYCHDYWTSLNIIIFNRQ